MYLLNWGCCSWPWSLAVFNDKYLQWLVLALAIGMCLHYKSGLSLGVLCTEHIWKFMLHALFNILIVSQLFYFSADLCVHT